MILIVSQVFFKRAAVYSIKSCVTAGIRIVYDRGRQFLGHRGPDYGPKITSRAGVKTRTLINLQTSADGTKRRYRLTLFSIAQNSLQ